MSLKALLSLSLLIIPVSVFSQTKLATDIYMQNDPLHIPKQYKNLVFKSNSPAELNDAFIYVFNKWGFNPVSYYSLFPAIRFYSLNYIDSILAVKNIELFVVINIESDVIPTGISFSGYDIGNHHFGYATVKNSLQMRFTLFFYDTYSSDFPFVRVDGHVLSKNGITRRDIPLAKKILHNSLEGLIEKGVLIINN